MVTTAKERERYGVGLRAEPDHQELGRRLKSDFKAVTAAVRGMGHTGVFLFSFLDHS